MPAGYHAQLHEAQCFNINTGCARTSVQGMSPKKLHEVTALTAHFVHLLRTSAALEGVRHVVDVGAGQVTISHQSWPPSEKGN